MEIRLKWAVGLTAVLLIGGTAAFMSHSTLKPAKEVPKPVSVCSAGASPAEEMICRDAGLQARAATMAVLLAASGDDVSGHGASQQQALQKKWLDSRGACAELPCLDELYKRRLKELAVAALFQAPEAALAELARQDPKSAPIYEAIYRYATIEEERERTDSVSRLIEPVFQELSSGSNNGRLEVGNARDAASSDVHFSAFLNVATFSGQELTLPCMALLRRPGLMATMDPMFGGAGDNLLIQNDCKEMTSDLKGMDRLVRKATEVQPACEGSLRFSLGLDYDKLLLRLRLHHEELFSASLPGVPEQTEDPPDAPDQVTEPKFLVQHQEEIQRATDELADYYTTHYAVPPDLAKQQARQGLSKAIGGAFHLCDF